MAIKNIFNEIGWLTNVTLYGLKCFTKLRKNLKNIRGHKRLKIVIHTWATYENILIDDADTDFFVYKQGEGRLMLNIS